MKSTAVIFIFLGVLSQLRAQRIEWINYAGSNLDDIGTTVIADNNGFIYYTGIFTANVDFDPGDNTLSLIGELHDIFIIKQEVGGDIVWIRKLGGNDTDETNSIGLDDDGNIYLAGVLRGTLRFEDDVDTEISSNGMADIFISKLDNSGNLIWLKQIGGTGDDFAHDLVIDKDGDILITGEFRNQVDFDPGPETYILDERIPNSFILKLSTAGEFKWVKTINSVFSWSIALDSKNNIYTSGGFRRTDFDPGPDIHLLTSKQIGDRAYIDAYILKLDSVGEFKWVVQFGGNLHDDCSEIIIDSQDNIVATGYFSDTTDFDPGIEESVLISSESTRDAYVLKIDSSGVFKWAQKFGGPGGDDGKALTLDDQENVVVAGQFPGVATFGVDANFKLTSRGLSDLFISMLNQDTGEPSWIKQIGGSSIDRIEAICTGNDNKIFGIGSFSNSVDFEWCDDNPAIKAISQDYFVFELDEGMIPSCENTIYPIACDSYPSPSGKYTYYESGIYLDTIPGIANEDSIFIIDLSILSSEIVDLDIISCTDSYVSPSGLYTWTISGILTDTLTSSFGCDSILRIDLKLKPPITEISVNDTIRCGDTGFTSPSGEYLWTHSGIYSDTLTTSYGCDSVITINLEIIDKTITYDSLEIQTCYGDEYLSPSGNYTWTNNGIYQDTVLTIAGCDSVLTIDISFKVFEEPPNHEWLTGNENSGYNYLRGLSMDGSNHAYILNSFSDSILIHSVEDSSMIFSSGGEDFILNKYTSNGNLLWAKHFGGPLNDQAVGIEIDEYDNLYILGTFSGSVDFDPGPGEFILTASGLNSFIVKLNPDGNLIWAKQLKGNTNAANAFKISQDDNIYLAGQFGGNVDFDPNETTNIISSPGQNYFILNLSIDGNYNWVRSAKYDSSMLFYSLEMGALNDIYVSGSFDGTVDFDPGPSTHNISGSVTGRDTFIQKLSSNGDFVWVIHLDSDHDVSFGSLQIDQNDNIFVAGYYTDSLDLDPGMDEFIISNTAVRNIFVAKYDKNGLFKWGKGITNPGNIYAYDLLLDPFLNLYITASFTDLTILETTPCIITPETSSGKMLLKLDSLGQYIWHSEIGDVTSVSGLGIADKNSIFLAGTYLRSMQLNTPNGIVSLNSQSFSTFIANMGDCNSNHYELDIQRCNSYGSPSGNYLWNESGIYQDTIWTHNGCFDAFNIQLEILNTPTVFDVEACASYLFNGVELTESGTFYNTLVSSSGCDSLVFLNLTIKPEFTDNIEITSCDSFSIDGHEFTGSGLYSLTYLSQMGCDSIVNISLTIDKSAAYQHEITSCEAYDFNGDILFESGNYQSIFTGTNGCDSLVNLNFTLQDTIEIDETAHVCLGDSYVFPDGFQVDNILTDLSHYSHLMSEHYCDSLVYTFIQVVYPSDTLIDLFACPDEVIVFNDIIIDDPEQDQVVLENVNGCDSIVTINITRWPVYQDTLHVISCSEYIFNDLVLKESGYYPFNFTTAYGCDSVIVIDFEITEYSFNIDVFDDFLSLGISEVDQDVKIKWFSCDNLEELPEGSGSVFHPIENGQYYAILELNDCYDTTSCVLFNNLPLKLPEQKEIKIYPNPAQDLIMVKLSKTQNIDRIDILEITGKVLKRFNLPARTEKIEMDISDIPPGVILINIFEDDKIVNQAKTVKL